ncbi:MAG: CAP domain-containing protein [Rhodobacteraceae bacterium]|nr:CAP domain-containing protein [Paracoccaceae bacterium]
MHRLISLLLVMFMALVACAPVSTSNLSGSDGLPLPRIYRIGEDDTSKLQFRMLDSINALRSASGLTPVQLNGQLNAAAATHSRDMSVQNRPWHFGSDGSSLIDRVSRTEYSGPILGENISETYETEIETLAAWMNMPGARSVIMHPAATNMGFAWFQENNGKIWWTLVMGS